MSVPLSSRSITCDLRSIPFGFRSVPLGPRNVPLDLRNIPLELRSLPLGLKNVPRDLWSIPLDLRNVPRDLWSIPLRPRNVPPGQRSGVLDLVTTSTGRWMGVRVRRTAQFDPRSVLFFLPIPSAQPRSPRGTGCSGGGTQTALKRTACGPRRGESGGVPRYSGSPRRQTARAETPPLDRMDRAYPFDLRDSDDLKSSNMIEVTGIG